MPPRLIAVALVVFALTTGLLTWLGATSPPLFGALLASVVVALRAPSPPAMPPSVRTLGMAIVGVAAGANVDSDVLHTIVDAPFAVAGGVLATLVVSMLVGQLLRLSREVDGVTALFASIAGGASGVSLAAREYGADDAVVISVQYLRVVLVLVTVPWVAPLLGDAGGAVLPQETAADVVSQHLYTATALAVGLLLARWLRFAVGPIVLTLTAASVLSVSGLFVDARVPAWVVAIGFAVVGANVGLSLTADRLRRLLRLFPLALVQAVLGIVACAGIGLLFAEAVGISAIDGYLATTPGGLPAVIAVAVDSGEAIGLILTMQFIRVFVALGLAPLLGWWLRRRGRPDTP